MHNLVVINGIDIVPRRSDLADRSLLFELCSISASARKTDEDFWGAFKAQKPEILGAIFDTLVRAMQVLPTLQFSGYARMADAHREMTAIAVALGIEQSEFERIFTQNRERLQDAYNQSSELVEVVVEFMRGRGSIDKPASVLYQELHSSIKGSAKFFPDSPSALSRKLNLEKDALFAAGYDFSKKRVGDFNHLVIIKIPQNQQTKAQRESAQRRTLLDDDDASNED